MKSNFSDSPKFPFLFGGTFIEGEISFPVVNQPLTISLPFRRDFH